MTSRGAKISNLRLSFLYFLLAGASSLAKNHFEIYVYTESFNLPSPGSVSSASSSYRFLFDFGVAMSSYSNCCALTLIFAHHTERSKCKAQKLRVQAI